MWGLPVNSPKFFPKFICRASGFLSCESPGIRNIHQTAAMPNKRKHSDATDEMLMAEVKKYPYLYNKKHRLFTKYNERREAWKKIAAVVGVSDKNAKLRWKDIKDSYGRYLRKMKRRVGTTGVQTYRFHYADHLEFLLPYYPGQSSSATGDEDQESADYAEDGEGEEEEDGFIPTATTVSHLSVKRSTQQDSDGSIKQDPDESMMEYLVTHDSAPREDALDTFFKSICCTVRKLPPITQAQLRFQITELVFKAEMGHLTGNVVNNVANSTE